MLEQDLLWPLQVQLSVLEPHLVDDQNLVLSVRVLLTAERNVATSMLRVDLPNSVAVLVVGSANVDRFVLLVEASLNSSGRNVTIAGINPGQVTVAWSYK